MKRLAGKRIGIRFNALGYNGQETVESHDYQHTEKINENYKNNVDFLITFFKIMGNISHLFKYDTRRILMLQTNNIVIIL